MMAIETDPVHLIDPSQTHSESQPGAQTVIYVMPSHLWL